MSHTNLPVPASANSKTDEKIIENVSINMFLNQNNKTVYLKELMSKYNHIIDKSLTNDFQEILKQYIYNKRNNYKYIETLMNKYVSSTISPDDRKYINNSLSEILRIHQNLFFKNIEIEFLDIQANSINQNDSDKKRITYIKKTTDDYINYLVRKKEISNENKYVWLYERYEYFPYEIQHMIDDIHFSTITYKQIIQVYKKQKKEGFTSKYDDKYLHKLVLKKKSRIMELNREELSYNKIQKQLTEECINENLIPSKIRRYGRAKNNKNKIIDVPTKLPLSGIKKLIAEELSKNVIDVVEDIK